MIVPFVDLTAQHRAVQKEIEAAIRDVITRSCFIGGPHVDSFEREFAEALGVGTCVSCANGTDAIYIVLKALGIGPGDEVITTAHSWISTSETITQAGARVVFVDTLPDTFTINPDLIEAKITPKTKAIIPVHLYGHPADIQPILAIARRHGLKVIEDCAQAHLATVEGRHVGTFGDAATFSFYPGKNLGAMGDAGCVVTGDAELARFCTLYARHGGKNEHVMEGINSRLDSLQAAILRVKLRKLAEWNEKRRTLARRYGQLLQGTPGLILPVERPGCTHVYHLYVVRHPQREALRRHLKERGVETALHYPKALPFYPAYRYLRHQPEDFPTAHAHQETILSLPMYPHLEEEQQNQVVRAIREFCQT
jgi:dTDP-4-amino-4,6-dideoxygalactose transaminase